MLKMSIIFINIPSSMLFMMYQPTDRKNKPLSYTTTPQTAHKLYFWWYKKCKNSDFGIVSYLQEVFPPHSKFLILLIGLLLVSKPDIEHGKPLFCMTGTSKNCIFLKNSYYETEKFHFLILGHRDLSRSGPYYGFIYSHISTNYHVGMSPKVPSLGLIKVEIDFFFHFGENA